MKGDSGLFRLSSELLSVLINPSIGGEVSSIVHRGSGVELLWQAPWRRKPRAPGSVLGEDAWVEGSGGGWQELFPNAGPACEFEGVNYGFHGPSSVEAWTRDGAAMSFETHGLRLERVVSLDGSTLRFDERVSNLDARPRRAVWVHHIAFGDQFLTPDVTVVANVSAGHRLPERSDSEDTTGSPTLDWSEWSHVSLQRQTSRFGRLVVRDGSYAIRNRRKALAVDVRWARDIWPYVWYWCEIRSLRDGPWMGRTRVLALEPSSVPHHLGLAAAARRGDALLLPPGASVEAWIELSVSSLEKREALRARRSGDAAHPRVISDVDT